MLRHLLIFVLTSVLAAGAARAESPGRSLSGVVADSSGHRPLAGASVSLVTPRDTLYDMTDARGVFRFGKLRDSSARIAVSYLGYKGLSRNVRLHAGANHADTLLLGEIPFDLGEIVVQGRRPLMSERGDTLVYHAENIHVMPGDEALQIVKRLPGMQYKDGTVKFMGKTIERTYVDGRPLFGENAQSALDFLAANDVVDIQVYDELPEEERMKGNQNGKKRTVMNLVTRSKPEKSVNIDFLAGYGADIDRGANGRLKGRYGAGASYNYFSERRIYMIEANSNNNNQGSNNIRNRFSSYSGGGQGDRRSTTASIDLMQRWGEYLTASGSYNFGNESTQTQTITQQIYFPTDAYRSRSSTDTTQNARLSRRHSASLNLRYNPKSDYVSFTPSIQFTDGATRSYRGAVNELDGEAINRAGATDRSWERGHNLTGNLFWVHSFKSNPKRALSLSVQGGSSKNTSDGWRIDSLSSDNDRTFLEIAGDGWNRSYGGNASYTEPFGEHNSLSVNYGISYENSRSKRLAVDRFTGRIDTTTTYDYTRNYTTQTAGLAFNRYTKTCYLSARLNYQSARENRDEAFPGPRAEHRTFNSLLPSVSMNYSLGETRSLYANYNASARQPSVEQLRSELNTRNRLSLTAGNPALRQSYTHSLSAGYYRTDPKTARSYGFSLRADLTSNDIASRRIFFAEETPLPEYNNYLAPKGSTLTTPVNVNGSGSVSAEANLSMPIEPLKTTFGCTGSVGFSRRPAYADQTLTYTNAWSPQFNFYLQSNQSTVYEFTLSSATSYSHSSNTQRNDNDAITEQANLGGRLNFLKKAYFETSYAFYFYHSFSYSGGNVATHTWNLSIGCKLFKDRSGDISFTVYDVLNRNDSFTSSMLSDYVTNSWSQMFGRYFSFSLGYRFNKTGKLKNKE